MDKNRFWRDYAEIRAKRHLFRNIPYFLAIFIVNFAKKATYMYFEECTDSTLTDDQAEIDAAERSQKNRKN